MTKLVRTEEIATEAELRSLFDMEPDQEIEACIPVCAGEWRSEGEAWRFYALPDWEAEQS